MSKELTQNQNKVQPPPRRVMPERDDAAYESGGHDAAARFAGGMEVMQRSMGNQALSGLVQRSLNQPESEVNEPVASDLNSPVPTGGVVQRSADPKSNGSEIQRDPDLEQGEEREDVAELAFDSIMERADGGEMPGGDGSSGEGTPIQRSLSTGDVSSDTLQTKRRRRGGSRGKKRRGSAKKSGRGRKKQKSKGNQGGGGGRDEGGGGGMADMLQGGAAEMMAGGGLEALMGGGDPMQMMMGLMGGGDPMQMMMQMMGGGGDMQAMMPLIMMMMQNK